MKFVTVKLTDPTKIFSGKDQNGEDVLITETQEKEIPFTLSVDQAVRQGRLVIVSEREEQEPSEDAEKEDLRSMSAKNLRKEAAKYGIVPSEYPGLDELVAAIEEARDNQE